ncbi:MAG: glycosyltransferase, partial [candidate division Zixibacteria bacterium]|nr:glycosyltransferase [candidate division Zixibacteria bacterium]
LAQEFAAGDKGKLKFLYAGTLYSYFNPVLFLESLAGWLNEYKVDRETIRVDFYGNYDFDYTGWVEQLGLKQVVRFHGFIPRSELLPIYQQADYFLLLLGFREQNRNVIPAKMFEYLASGAKILALAPDGVAVDLIKRYKAGIYISEPDKKQMMELLQRLYQDWLAAPLKPRKYRYIEEIDRLKLTGKLAAILDSTTGFL